ncbi:DUF1800 domain-containing protein [Planctopirus hydrillae]|uniref:DUF1800 domain-containing protein n=1 Tax=Planctopirus hydrillae TaxID=1841610 RepID=A0A1C3EN47_9PLAN|nr:DUF1800 domain-containing protein [Planctopirus hydrillae]ODA34629.1 hypothetical protein A6X21_02810 [Planctopirus hydrillae]
MPRNRVHEAQQSGWSSLAARHLLARTGFGFDLEQEEKLAVLSREQAVDQLLEDAQNAPCPTPPEWVKTPWVNTERRYADTSADEFRGKHGATNGRYAREIADLRRWWVNEMMTSPVPLREMMTLFWHGHFASSIGKVLISQAMYEQNATQRKHALGNFRQLLKAMTIDGAMMIYLDLEDSEKTQPNENYARELFELFALGHGHYTQADIREAARALSGWQLNAPPGTALPQRPTNPADNRRFTRDGIVAELVVERHDAGTKTIFGKTGTFGLDEVIELTVNHPACGLFLAEKLASYFGLSDETGRVQQQMAEVFRSTGGEIAPMLRVLFTADEFYTDGSRNRLIKSPVVLWVSTCRQLQLDTTFTRGVNKYLAALGQELFEPPNVKGWPGGETWISAGTLALRYHLTDIVLESKEPPGMDPMGRDRGRPVILPKDPAERAKFLARLEGGMSDGEGMMAPRRGEREAGPAYDVKFSPDKLFPAGIPDSSADLADQLLNRLLVDSPRAELRATAMEAATRNVGPLRVQAVLRLILSSPDYQLT